MHLTNPDKELTKILNIRRLISKTDKFINKLETSEGFKLFERSEVSPYSRCFVIFIKSLISLP